MPTGAGSSPASFTGTRTPVASGPQIPNSTVATTNLPQTTPFQPTGATNIADFQANLRRYPGAAGTSGVAGGAAQLGAGNATDKSDIPTFMKLFAQGMEAQGNFSAASNITDLGNLQADFYRQEGERQMALARLSAYENDKVGSSLLGTRRTTNKGTVSGVGSNLVGLMDIDQERSFQTEKILQGGRSSRDRLEGQAVSTQATAGNKAREFRAKGVTGILKGAGIGYGLRK